MNKWYIPKHLIKNISVAESWLDQCCCTHYDHDDENVCGLFDRYGIDYWDAHTMIQANRRLKGMRHICRDKVKGEELTKFGKRFDLKLPAL